MDNRQSSGVDVILDYDESKAPSCIHGYYNIIIIIINIIIIIIIIIIIAN